MSKIVIKIGGSLLYTDGVNVNTSFIEKLRDWYYKNLCRYDKMIIVVGGGKLSRVIADQVKEIIPNTNDVHDIAMQGTILNSELVQGIIGDKSIFVPKSFAQAVEAAQDDKIQVVLSGGLKPGWSTDMDSAVLADVIGQKRFYKFSIIDRVYTKDPRVFPDAKPIDMLTWKQYFELFGINELSQHSANANIPIDVNCAKFCNTKGMTVHIAGGNELFKVESLSAMFSAGTLIRPAED